MKKKFISLVLVTAMVFSLLSFGSPSASAYVYSPELSVSDGFMNAAFDFLYSAYRLTVKGAEITAEDVNSIGSKLSFPAVGKVSYKQLEHCVEYYNASFWGHVHALIGNKNFQSRGAIRYDAENDIYRIYDHAVGHWVTDGNGDFPYTDAKDLSGDVPAGEDAGSYGGLWLSASGSEITNGFSRTSYEALASKQLQLSEWGHPCDLVKVKIGPKGKEVECWVIRDAYWYYYCDQNGNRYAAVIEPSVTETVRPSIDNSGNLIEGDNGLILDVEDNVLNLIGQLGDQFQLNIDDMVFDFGTNSYTVNAYTTINEGDNYYFTYYTYNIQYNITNTYITYIGSNDAYEREEYELYYQLPDGRSSADLTAEEVAGMSFEFYDVMNYQRSTDDISVRALYHFDGNLEDSSYFSTPDRFAWLEGASITYMESPSAFGGNLYLDNTHHQFSLELPSYITGKDFTIQFRYYQASEPDTQSNIENSLCAETALLVEDTLLKWDESTLYDRNGNPIGALQVGTWNEIAIVRHLGSLFYYINGHFVQKLDGTVVFGNHLEFTFGDTSRAYSMIDELRVLNVAMVEAGADYSPTAVPHDSNLTLVLPGAARPIADEYNIAVSSYENLFGNVHNYIDHGNLDHIVMAGRDDNYPEYTHVESYDFPYFQYRNNGLYSIVAADDSVAVTRLPGRDPYYSKYHKDDSYYYFGLATSVHTLKANTDYTLSIMHTDGSVDSFTFNRGSYPDKFTAAANSGGTVNTVLASKSFDWGKMQLQYITYDWVSGSSAARTIFYARTMLCIAPNADQILDIAYIELVEGKETDLHMETVTAVYDAVDLKPNTAAIQTIIPVKGYIVGGVRPSLPERGDCWFPVSNNRITSVQVYTGTHWEEVNARWWTGTRWIPIYAFDITTLEDLFDIADGDSVVPLLPDQNSFLRWWQLQWLDFRAWLEGALSNIGSGGGGTSLPDDETLPGEVDDPATDDDDGWSFVDLLVKTKDGIWRITKGIVRTAAGGITGLVVLINDAGDFFEPFQEGYTDGVGDLMDYGGDDIWD